MAIILRRSSTLLSAMIFSLVGCSGSSDSPDNVLQALEPNAGPVPIVSKELDCSSNSPAQTTDAPVMVAGLWVGNMMDCGTLVSRPVMALINEDGNFYIFSPNSEASADLLAGTTQVYGDRVAGNGRYFYSDGYECAECWASFAGFEAIVDNDGDSMKATWSGDWTSYGYLNLEFDAVNYEGVASATGSWTDWGPNYDEQHVHWAVTGDGSVVGTDKRNCNYIGSMSTANPAYNLHLVSVSVEGCDLAGSFSGVATRLSGPFNDRLLVSLNDGKQRSLRFLFLSD